MQGKNYSNYHRSTRIISIYCHVQAAEENIAYPGYTFITPHWYEHNWWSVESHCTEQELMSVLNNTLSVALEPEVGIILVNCENL